METWIVLRKLQEEKSDSQESKGVFKFMIWRQQKKISKQ